MIDGFESFAYSQYHPLHLNLGIGGDTGFTTPSPPPLLRARAPCVLISRCTATRSS